MAAKYNEFKGKWDDVEYDGMWDTADEKAYEAANESGDWEDYDNEDLPSPRHFDKMNKGLEGEGLIVVWYWYGGDPGMGGASRMFELPPDRV